jgi:hypothetical protein
VRLSPLFGPLYQPRMVDECGAVCGIIIGRGNRSTGENPTPRATLSTTNSTSPDLGYLFPLVLKVLLEFTDRKIVGGRLCVLGSVLGTRNKTTNKSLVLNEVTVYDVCACLKPHIQQF